MKKSDELKQKRASKMKEMDRLISTRNTEKRAFSVEEERSFDALEGEINSFDTQIERELKIEAQEKRSADDAAAIAATANFGGGADGGEAKEKRKLRERVSLTKALRNASSNRPLDGAEKEMNELALEENKRAGVVTPDNAKLSIPLSFLRAEGQTVTQDTGGYGGALVHDDAPRVQMPFESSGLLDTLGVTRLTGLSGGDVPLPVMGDYDFNWLSEEEEITLQKAAIAGPKLSPNRLGAAVKINNRLLSQTSMGVDNIIRGLILSGYDRALTSALINGSGTSNQPEGILNNSGVQTGASTDADVPTKALIAELISLIELADADGGALKFLGSPSMKYLAEITKLDAGSGRFLMEKMNELLGYQFVSSNLVPDLAGNHPLIFGDFSKAFVGEWGAISVLSDPYTTAGSNSVKLILNAHADVAIAQPTAFAVNKFFNAVGV
jgi:HK97 family phage major capsid protein